MRATNKERNEKKRWPETNFTAVRKQERQRQSRFKAGVTRTADRQRASYRLRIALISGTGSSLSRNSANSKYKSIDEMALEIDR